MDTGLKEALDLTHSHDPRFSMVILALIYMMEGTSCSDHCMIDT